MYLIYVVTLSIDGETSADYSLKAIYPRRSTYMNLLFKSDSVPMTSEKAHLRYCILYELQQGRNAIEACSNVFKVLKVKTGHGCDFDLSDKLCSEWPSLIEDERCC